MSTPLAACGRAAALGGDLDALAVDDQVVAIDFDGAVEGAMNRVMAKQARIRLGIAQVVDRHQFKVMVGPLENGARHIATDTSETVDCDFHCHVG
jgi:hypothetical protein